MTTKTITFDPEIYALVPRKLTSTAHHNMGDLLMRGLTRNHGPQLMTDMMLASAPDVLPGVVEHSGEPKAYLLLDQGCRAPDDCEDYERVELVIDISANDLQEFQAAGRATPLFTHAAPVAKTPDLIDIGSMEYQGRTVTDWVIRSKADAAAMGKINAIRHDIVRKQNISWSAHIYPLVEALNAAGYAGVVYASVSEMTPQKQQTTMGHP